MNWLGLFGVIIFYLLVTMFVAMSTIADFRKRIKELERFRAYTEGWGDIYDAEQGVFYKMPPYKPRFSDRKNGLI
jgi:hypothetical protein